MDTIIVVDDEPGYADLIALVIASPERRIIVAQDGLEALDLVRRERPSLLLIDVRLPGMSGIDVCRQVAADSDLKRTKLVVLSAAHDVEVRQLAREVGATFLTKPTPIADLQRIVEMLLPVDDER